MTKFAGPHYLRADDGTCFYPIADTSARHRIIAGDGWKLIDQRLGQWSLALGTNDVLWVATPGPVDKIELTVRSSRTHTGWELSVEGAASEKFPQALTIQEWEQRGWDDEDTSQDAFMARRLYQRVHTETAQPNEVLDTTDLTCLDGAPDPDPESPWIADQPGALVYSAGYHHLMRGVAPGLHAHIAEALKAAGYSVYEWQHDGNVEVTLSLPFESPRWFDRPRRGRSGRPLKATDRIQKTNDIKLRFKPVDLVAGPNKATAYAAFDRIAQEWVDWVASHRMTVCDHCGGAGAVHQSATRPQVAK